MYDLIERTGKLPVLVIFAPTACGKTKLALDLFGKNSLSLLAGRAEIISADSMQVYKGMDIGTAKPDSFLLENLPHHLIDVNSPDEPFSVGDFVRYSDELCHEIYSRGKIPVMLGGTGFYIRNFMLGLPTTPEADETLRNALKQRLETEGAEKLYSELKELDPVSADKIHQNDHYRILRALEVCHASGKPRSSFALEQKVRDGYNFCTIILEREREELYQRINMRVDEMVQNGLVEEIEKLIAKGFNQDSAGMQAIGYREYFSDEVQNVAGKDEKIAVFKDLVAKDSRHYAKRQYTFMRGIPGARYFNADSIPLIEQYIIEFLKTEPCIDCNNDL